MFVYELSASLPEESGYWMCCDCLLLLCLFFRSPNMEGVLLLVGKIG